MVTTVRILQKETELVENEESALKEAVSEATKEEEILRSEYRRLEYFKDLLRELEELGEKIIVYLKKLKARERLNAEEKDMFRKTLQTLRKKITELNPFTKKIAQLELKESQQFSIQLLLFDRKIKNLMREGESIAAVL